MGLERLGKTPKPQRPPTLFYSPPHPRLTCSLLPSLRLSSSFSSSSLFHLLPGPVLCPPLLFPFPSAFSPSSSKQGMNVAP